tara:strand:- start:1460 stop:2677 length:1218 start_codon:yes stop_codon:yes gene_type:complete
MEVGDLERHLGIPGSQIKLWAKKSLIKSFSGTGNKRLFLLEEVRSQHLRMQGKSEPTLFKVLESGSRTPYTCIDLFAGAGGTALGLSRAGLNHTLLVENDRDAASTLESNMKDWNVRCANVEDVDFTNENVDVIEAGFPCQAFSYAGNKRGFGDTRGTLFFEFARALEQSRPKIAIGENVRGMLKHDGGRTLSTILEKMGDLGYSVGYKILRSQYLDVAQKRERLFIIGVRKDLDFPILFPKEQDYLLTLRDVFKDVPRSIGQQYSEKKQKVLEQVPPGGYWRDLPEEVQKEYMGVSYYRTGGRTGMARRLAWDEPSLTLTCSPGQKHTERCHPGETRPLTVREYARVQSFPDEWEFRGSLSSQYKQIGNAVPVNMAYHIGRSIIAMLDGEYDETHFERFDRPEN